jgi:hypothetical protein
VEIQKALATIEIPEEFHDWAMNWLRVENAKESVDRNTILATQQRTYEACLKKIDRLIDMRAAGEISEEEFVTKKNESLKEKAKLQALLKATDERADSWLQTAEQILIFAQDAREKFAIGTLSAKRTVLSALGSNLLLKDKKLNGELDKALLPLQRIAEAVREHARRFEPLTNPRNKLTFEELCMQSPMWLAAMDSNLS